MHSKPCKQIGHVAVMSLLGGFKNHIGSPVANENACRVRTPAAAELIVKMFKNDMVQLADGTHIPVCRPNSVNDEDWASMKDYLKTRPCRCGAHPDAELMDSTRARAISAGLVPPGRPGDEM